MSSARYVGRVGALAVALGIGAVIAGVPGVAWAAPEGESDPSDAPGVSAPENPDGSAEDPSDTDVGGGDLGAAGDGGGVGDGGDVDGAGDSAGGMQVENSGGAITSTNPGSAGAKSEEKDRDADPPKKRAAAKQKAFSVAPSLTKTTTHSTEITVAEPGPKVRAQAPALSIASPKDPGPQIKPPTSSPDDVAPLTLAAPGLQKQVPARMTAVTKPLAQSPVLQLLPFVTLAPTADGKLPGSTESTLLLGFLAAGRQVDKKAAVEDESLARTVDSTETSLMLAAAAATGPPTVGTLNQDTGVITGSLNGYTVTGQPTSGKVTVTGDTYTYTPTVAARLRAGLTTQPDYDSFTVAMSGQPAATVTVPVMPAVLSDQTSIPVAGQPALTSPTGIAVNGTAPNIYAYVTNQGTNTNTVTVINAVTGAVVKTITVGSQPSAVAISPTAARAFVANRASGTVTVINTDTNTVVGSAIRVGSLPQDVAVNASGTQVLVANNGSNFVSLIEPAQNNKVTTILLGSGNSAPTAVAFSADGSRAYVTHRTITGGGAVSVINTSTKKVISTVAVGSAPQDVAVAGTNVYVANSGSSSVSVINTAANNSVTTINVGSSPTSLAVSPDGSMVVVARTDDNIEIIDTKTNTVIGAQHLLDANTTPSGGHVVAFGSDGRVLITDAVDHTVRVVGLARGNTAPIATAEPDPGTQDSVTGAVAGALNIDDPDQDPLRYTASGVSEATGTVTFTPTGTYTFTPSQAARDAAALTSTADFVTFTVHASDDFGGSKDAIVTVPVLPTPVGNRPPQAGTPSVGTPNRLTGEVSGLLKFTDLENDPMTYSVPAQPSSGTVALVGSTYTFTPNQAARDAAAISQGPDEIDITVVASDGELFMPVTFSVPVLPPNRGPVDGIPSVDSVDSYGAVSGSLNFTDADNDKLTYSVPVQPASGTVTVTGSTYTYTPTVAARAAAFASQGEDFATITVVASDGLASDSVTFSVPISPAQRVNTAPVIFEPGIISTDAATGRVLGQLRVEDPQGDPVTYSVSTQGSYGTASVDASGAFRYTPMQAARLSAAQTPMQDTFYVTVSDGLASSSKPVTVTVSPAVLSGLTSSAQVGTSPTGVGVSQTKVYVANQLSDTVSVIDRSNPTVAPVTINVVDSPTAIAMGPTGSDRAYVAGNNGVTVINTATNQVITTVSLNGGGQSYGIAVAPDGQRVFVTMTGTNRVAVINANVTANTYTLDPTVSVGSSPRGITLNGDGTRGYVANWASGTVTVLDTSAATPAVISTLTAGTNPVAIAASADGTRIYVSNYGSSTVQVLNPTAQTPLVATIPVGTQPNGIALSPDGSVLYVANANDTVSVISTRSNQVIGTAVSVDAAPEADLHSIAVSPDGRQVYVTDLFDRTVRILTIAKPTNQAPWVPGKTIPGGPDPVSGNVTGRMNVEDRDGDALTFTLASPPTQGGTVTFDQYGSGYFTYTPSPAARAQAAQTPGLDYDTFSVNVTDGTATVTTTVKVQVAPALPPTTPTTNNPVSVGTGPSGVVALQNGYAYVVDYDSNTVTVTNTATKQVVKTIDVGAGPLSVAAVDTPQRQRIYVSNSLSNTVSVIDPNTNSVVDTITVSIPPSIYENPEWGSFQYQNRITEVVASENRLYVSATDGSLRVYDTTNDGTTLIRTVTPGVFNDIELSPDGTRLYGTSGSQLTVLNTATMAGVPVTVGPGSGEQNAEGNRLEYTNGVGNVAVSPDGKRTYVTYGVTILESGVGGQRNGSFVTDAQGKTWMVTGGYNAISVIDTDPTSVNYNKEIARIHVSQGAQELVVSGNRLYVLNPDNKTVTMIDTATNQLVGSFTTDQSTAGRDGIYILLDDWYPMFSVPASSRYITVGANGTVYVTDYADGKMYAVTVGSPNV